MDSSFGCYAILTWKTATGTALFGGYIICNQKSSIANYITSTHAELSLQCIFCLGLYNLRWKDETPATKTALSRGYVIWVIRRNIHGELEIV